MYLTYHVCTCIKCVAKRILNGLFCKILTCCWILATRLWIHHMWQRHHWHNRPSVPRKEWHMYINVGEHLHWLCQGNQFQLTGNQTCAIILKKKKELTAIMWNHSFSWAWNFGITFFAGPWISGYLFYVHMLHMMYISCILFCFWHYYPWWSWTRDVSDQLYIIVFTLFVKLECLF